MFEFISKLWSSQVGFPFDSRKLELESDKPLSTQLDEVFGQIRQIHSQDKELVVTIDKAWKGCKFLLEIAPLYDYANVRANGYWSFGELIIKFGKVVLLTSNGSNFNREQAIHILHILNTGLTLCYKIRNKESFRDAEPSEDEHLSVMGTDLFPEDSLFASKLDFVDLLSLMKSLKGDLTYLYAFFNSCWLSPSISYAMQFISAFLAIYSSQWKTPKIYNWTSRYNRGIMFANMSQNINIDCLQSMWNLTEYRLIRSFMNMRNKSIYSKNVYAPRQSRWKVAVFEGKVYDQTVPCQNVRFSKCAKSSVRCLLLRSFQASGHSRSILFHIHGGGFISQSPECHQVYLNDWAEALKDITILSVDYSLSPQSSYPEALQEVLDCYLWLISRDPQVEESIGFYPEKIAFCGDSAGGNLCMALVLALNDIRRKLKQSDTDLANCPFPVGLFCFYTPFLLNTIVSPSRMVVSVESLMPLGTLLSCLAAYAGCLEAQEVPLTNSPKKAMQTHHDALQTPPTTLVSMIGLIYHKITSTFRSALTVKRVVPWYKKPDLRQSLFKLNNFVSNPFISPLLSPDIAEEHFDIKLFLYPNKYCAFLDDSVEMAKLWKGPVHLEVLDELPHGFLNLIRFCEKAKKASDVCIEHILDVLS